MTSKIFVIGGWTHAGDHTLVAAYDFQTAKWNRVPSLPLGRAYLGAATINGKLYAIGGRDTWKIGGSIYNTIDVFDPSTQNWTSGPTMNYERCGLGVSVLDEKICAVGGYDGSTQLSIVEILDPQLGKWTVVGRGMNIKRTGLAVNVLNGYIYATGGWDGSEYLRTVEKMNPATGDWFFVAPMNTVRAKHCAAVLDGKLYVIGGEDRKLHPLKSVEVYDPISDRWTMVADLIKKRNSAGAVTYGGQIYVVGGQPYLRSSEVYNPLTNTWTILHARMSKGCRGHCIALL